MNGMAALLHLDGRIADPEAVWAMLRAVPYRALDGMCVRQEGPLALGCAKTTVTPEEESEQQPLRSERTGCTIVADVRLDNRDELMRALPNHPASATSDTALILLAYETWGGDAVARLLGDFAFVIWDPQLRRLFGARDTSGQRTLFYRHGQDTFAAASEIHQLLQDPAVPFAPNHDRIRDALVPLNIFRLQRDQATTFYEGIFSVPAAHTIAVDHSGVRVRRYWEFAPPAELRYRRDEEYAEHYRELLFEVLRTRLRSAHPLGLALSGGLDSTSLACAAQELFLAGRAPDPGFVGFSMLYEGLECDEREFIAEIQRKYGFPVHQLAIPEHGGWLREPDGFQTLPNIGLHEVRRSLFGAAVGAGVRVMLTGDMADSFVGGMPQVFDSLLARGNVREFGRRLIAHQRSTRESLKKTLLLDCILPFGPRALQRQANIAYQRRSVRRTRQQLLPFWIPDELRGELVDRHLELLLEQERHRRFANPGRHLEGSVLYPTEIAVPAAPWPVELCRPFADRRLHEFFFAIPPEQKFAPHPQTDEYYAGSKRLPRLALRGLLPEGVRTRTTKTVFDSHVSATLQQQWPQLAAAFGPGSRPEIGLHGYIDPARFWARLQLFRDGYTGDDGSYLMNVLALETWLRGFTLARSRATTIAPPRTPALQEVGV